MTNPVFTRQRRSRDEWQRLITDQERVPLSQQAYCHEKALALSTFQNWKRRLAAMKQTATDAGDEWLELPLRPEKSAVANWDIELDLGNGLCLRLRQR